MKRRLLSTLGVCKKAGKLAEGFDPVAEAVDAGKARLILTASDLSLKSGKEMARVAEKGKVEIIGAPVTMDEFWAGLGRRAGIISVNDDGLAGTVRKALEALKGSAGDTQREEGREESTM